MFAGKKSAQIREILISESAWEEMTCLFAPSLTMWVKRLVSQLKKAQPDCKLPEKAMDYLKRNGLISVEDVLR